jgi:MFS family permease
VGARAAIAVSYVCVVFMSTMDTTIVNVALPAIGRSFSAAPAAMDGISVGYLMSLAVCMPASGWLGDRFGRKRTLLTATVMFTVASALCGLAHGLGELIAFRVLQGAVGVLLTPVGLAMLLRAYPPGERLRGLRAAVHPGDDRPGGAGPVLGGLLSSAGLGLLMYGVCEGSSLGWGSPGVLATVAAGGAALLFLVRVEVRAADPVVPVRLLGDRLFRAGTGVSVLLAGGFIGTLYVMSVYLQDGRGLSSLAAGLTIFPEAAGMAAGSQLASRVLYRRLGPRRQITTAVTLLAVTIGLLAAVGPGASLWWVRLLMFGCGLAMAQVFVGLQTASFATIAAHATGRASTLFSSARQLGAAAGVAALGTVIGLAGSTVTTGGHPEAGLGGYRVALLAAAACCLACLPFALGIRDTEAAATIPGGPAPSEF